MKEGQRCGAVWLFFRVHRRANLRLYPGSARGEIGQPADHLSISSESATVRLGESRSKSNAPGNRPSARRAREKNQERNSAAISFRSLLSSCRLFFFLVLPRTASAVLFPPRIFLRSTRLFIRFHGKKHRSPVGRDSIGVLTRFALNKWTTDDPPIFAWQAARIADRIANRFGLFCTFKL